VKIAKLKGGFKYGLTYNTSLEFYSDFEWTKPSNGKFSHVILLLDEIHLNEPMCLPRVYQLILGVKSRLILYQVGPDQISDQPNVKQ